MPAIGAIVTLLIPALVVGAAFIPTGDGPSAAATRIAAPLLAGLGLAPVAFALPLGRACAMFLAIVGATAGGVATGFQISNAGGDLGTLVGWVVLTFAGLAGLVSPILAFGFRGAAAAAWLLAAALCSGAVLLARDSGGSVPQPLLDYNPIVRLLWNGLGYDWLHAANMYPRVGSLYYRYPARTDGIPVILIAAAAGVAAGGLIALARRRRVVTP